MAIAKIIGAQIDFSAGELDESIKRAHESIQKIGARQMANWRILSSKAISNRSGRSALFPATGRTEELPMPGGSVFFLNFAAGSISIFNSAGAQVFTASTIHHIPTDGGFAIPWTALTLAGIVWAQIGKAIYIAYPDGAPNNIPQVLSFDGVSTWTLLPYIETVQPSGQKRTPFYRISPANITLLPSATTGNINVTFSSSVLAPGSVGTRFEYCGLQLTSTSVSNSTSGTATVNETLPTGQVLTFTSAQGQINIGDVVKGSITGATGIATATSSGTQVLHFASHSGWPQPASGVGDTLIGGTSATHGIVTAINYFYDSQAPATFYITDTVQITSGSGFTTGEAVTGTNGTFNPFSVTTNTANS